MKTKLIELLNKLIEKGWSPFGYHEGKYGYNEIEYFNNELILSFGEGAGKFVKTYSLRNISSIDSGLWQFVCENRKRGYTIPECWIKNPKICDEGIESVEKECNQNSYEYYIIESALTDESELEQFLLDNIKIEG